MDSKSWERLEKVIKWAGMSTHAFAMKIGMKRSENLYRIMRNKENVSIKLAMMIIDTYPQINRNWLVYGEGDMIVDDVDMGVSHNSIPYYSVSIEGLMGDFDGIKPAYKLHLPMFNNADLAVNYADKAMEPAIPTGSVIVLRKQAKDFIIYGQTYYVECDELSVVRVVRKNDADDSEVILEAINSEKYDNITIKRDSIRCLYYVCGAINRL